MSIVLAIFYASVGVFFSPTARIAEALKSRKNFANAE